MLNRKLLEAMYRKVRGTKFGIDPAVPMRSLIEYSLKRAVRLLRGLGRLQRIVFMDRGVSLNARNMIRIGRAVSIGRGVHIDGLSRSGITLGDRVTIDIGAILRGSGVIRNLGEGIHISDGTAIGARNFLHGGGGIYIGENCLFGPSVMIFSEDHEFHDPAVLIREQGEKRNAVRIERDVWLGANVVVLAGVSIGEGSVVAAGAVVTKSLGPFGVFAGIPARRIGDRSVGRAN